MNDERLARLTNGTDEPRVSHVIPHHSRRTAASLLASLSARSLQSLRGLRRDGNGEGMSDEIRYETDGIREEFSRSFGCNLLDPT